MEDTRKGGAFALQENLHKTTEYTGWQQSALRANLSGPSIRFLGPASAERRKPLSPSPTTPRPGEILKDVVQRLTSLFVAAFNKRDIEAVLTFYAPDAVLLPPDHPRVKGTTAIRDLLEEMFHAGYSNTTLERGSMAHLGDLAVEIGSYSMQVPDKEAHSRQESGKYVTAWRRQPNGEFQITVTIWSCNP